MSNCTAYTLKVLATIAAMDEQILANPDRAAHIFADVQAFITEAVGTVTGEARQWLVGELVTTYAGLIDTTSLYAALERAERLDCAA